MRKIVAVTFAVITVFLCGATAALSQQYAAVTYALEIPGQQIMWGINPADYKDKGIVCQRPVNTPFGGWQSHCRLGGAMMMIPNSNYQGSPPPMVIMMGRWHRHW